MAIESCYNETLARTIAADPDNTGARLVYTDWLTDRAEYPEDEAASYAALIREQCRGASAAVLFPPEAAPLPAELRVALGRQAAAWVDQLAAIGVPLSDPWFDRGCLAGGRIDADALLMCGEPLFEIAPIQHLHLSGLTPDSTRALARCTLLGRLRSLTVSFAEDHPAPDITPLVASPHLHGLQGLGVTGAHGGGAVARGVAGSPGLPHLRRLRLPGAMEDGGFRALVTSNRFPRLEALDVADGAVTADGIAALVDGSALPSLRSLNLSGNEYLCGTGGLDRLIYSQFATRLRALGLARCEINAYHAVDIAISRFTFALAKLDLAGNPLGDSGAIRFVSTSRFDSLEDLSLAGCGIADRGIDVLIERAPFPHLKRLDVSGNDISASTRQHLRDVARSRSIHLVDDASEGSPPFGGLV